MPKLPKPFNTPRRTDSKTYQLTLNYTCGLPERVCDEWKRRSFHDLPDELAQHRSPKTKAAAEAGAFAFIAYLKGKQEEGSARRVRFEDITVGAWISKFTAIETSPQAGVVASRNGPYSVGTLRNYKDYYENHIKADQIFTKLAMAELEEDDAIGFCNRLSVKKLKDGRLMGGTRAFKGVMSFVTMAFNNYQRKNRRWINPFSYIDSPNYKSKTRDALPEDEVIKLFEPGVLKTKTELVVCAAMFLSGLRRGEIFALKPEDLDWKTPKITIERAWQLFETKTRVIGPPKGKKSRDAPFDPILQEAIRKLWEENGQHVFVVCNKHGKIPGPSWLKERFPQWLKRAGIELGGRRIVPHSARHSLASLLEARGVSLRYIQDLLGHSDLKTTMGYLHSTKETIRIVGKKISEAMESDTNSNIVNFKISS